jgi:hypothetical protein
LEQSKKRHFNLKINVLTHYGNGNCKCMLCGESRHQCLSIDHVNGGGSKHVKQIKTSLYQWLKNNNFPGGFQTLCMNCQFIKRTEEGECIRRFFDE